MRRVAWRRAATCCAAKWGVVPMVIWVRGGAHVKSSADRAQAVLSGKRWYDSCVRPRVYSRSLTARARSEGVFQDLFDQRLRKNLPAAPGARRSSSMTTTLAADRGTDGAFQIAPERIRQVLVFVRRGRLVSYSKARSLTPRALPQFILQGAGTVAAWVTAIHEVGLWLGPVGLALGLSGVHTRYSRLPDGSSCAVASHLDGTPRTIIIANAVIDGRGQPEGLDQRIALQVGGCTADRLHWKLAAAHIAGVATSANCSLRSGPRGPRPRRPASPTHCQRVGCGTDSDKPGSAIAAPARAMFSRSAY